MEVIVDWRISCSDLFNYDWSIKTLVIRNLLSQHYVIITTLFYIDNRHHKYILNIFS